MARKKPSRKQINLAKLTLEHPTMPKGELVALGGYGEAVVQTPSKALESKGYLEALDTFGLTDELLTTSLVSDIKAKPKNRVAELRLGSEIRGLTKREIGEENKKSVIAIQVIVNGTDNLKDRTNGEAIVSA